MEKRRAKRIPKRITVRFGEQDFARSGITNDISSTGLFVISAFLPPLDSRVHLQLCLAPDRSVFLEGIVRRHRVAPPQLRQIQKAGFGVSFLTPAEIVGELVPKSNEDGSRFIVDFHDPKQLRQAIDQEIRYGGIFLRTEAQPARDAAVIVEMSLEFANRKLAFPARVVQIASTTSKGVGVAFDDKQQVIRALESLLIPAAG